MWPLLCWHPAKRWGWTTFRGRFQLNHQLGSGTSGCALDQYRCPWQSPCPEIRALQRPFRPSYSPRFPNDRLFSKPKRCDSPGSQCDPPLHAFSHQCHSPLADLKILPMVEPALPILTPDKINESSLHILCNQRNRRKYSPWHFKSAQHIDHRLGLHLTFRPHLQTTRRFLLLRLYSQRNRSYHIFSSIQIRRHISWSNGCQLHLLKRH